MAQVNGVLAGVDDGRVRKGTVWTATAHAVTAIIGSGVLALPWSVAQLGWLFGPMVLVFFAYVTYYTANLLADCYRIPGPAEGTRNYTYMDAVRSFLGKRDVLICGIGQYCLLWGNMVAYTITATMSLMSIKLTHCHHKHGRNATCQASGVYFTMIFGLIEVVLSQFPNLEEITIMSYIAAAMSFTYSSIVLLLCGVAFAGHHEVRGTLLGEKVHGTAVASRMWSSFQALGNIAFAYTYAMVLIEIQDTLKSPPSENKTMKRASFYGIGATTLFYISLGCLGYAAFGNKAPGNIITGFYEPFWLIDIANIAVVVHLIGAYQVFAQPVFAFYEEWLTSKYPNVAFFHNIYTLRLPFPNSMILKFTPCRLILRSGFVAFTTVLALMLPFFNAVVGLLGSVAFWPLTVNFPVAMHIQQVKVKKRSPKWVALQAMSFFCLLVSIFGTIGSVAEISAKLKNAKLFQLEL